MVMTINIILTCTFNTMPLHCAGKIDTLLSLFSDFQRDHKFQ